MRVPLFVLYFYERKIFMKKFVFVVLAAALAAGCGASGEGVDTSLLTGVEAQSQDGSLSILLPDETFMMTNSTDGSMDFEGDEGYISVMKSVEYPDEPIYDIVPESEEEVLELFGGVNAELEINDFSFEEKDGVKYYSSAVVVTGYKEDETAEEENFIIIENLKADGSEYYYATAEIYDESLIEKVAASLATFGDTVQ